MEKIKNNYVKRFTLNFAVINRFSKIFNHMKENIFFCLDCIKVSA